MTAPDAGASAADGSPGGEIVLVRHAETQWSLDGRHTGRTDLPLTDAGRARAAELEPALAGLKAARVLCSPLLRARETCELAGLGDSPQLRDDLQEWDYGSYEGLTSAQIAERRPGWSLWRDGCPGGEDAAAVGARADRVIAELAGAPGTSVVFAHGHILRVLGARWIGAAPSAGERLGLSTAAVCVLGREHGAAILARWNATPTG